MSCGQTESSTLSFCLCSRIGCYVTVFENISNLRDVFYKEMSGVRCHIAFNFLTLSPAMWIEGGRCACVYSWTVSCTMWWRNWRLNTRAKLSSSRAWTGRVFCCTCCIICGSCVRIKKCLVLKCIQTLSLRLKIVSRETKIITERC